jgi:phosphate:Na+ symporter
MGLLGGLALFLYGMERMAEALKDVAGDRMKSILARLSNNRVIGLLTGLGLTALIQSSSVTTVMLVGFVSADLMSFSQSIGVILGANIGTTVTAQIVAFKVTKIALALIAGGFAVLFLSKDRVRQKYGYIVMGLGLIFFGMSVMSDAMKPLRDYTPFIALMSRMSNPVLGILAGAGFTGLVQSSSATMGVVIVLAMQGVISLEAGLALALGANVGTCITAALAAIGKPREAVRVAAAHVLFKVVGVLIALPLIPQIAELVRALSPPGDTALTGQALLAEVVPRQVANAHTLFNSALALLFLPLIGPFSRLVTRLVPDRPEAEEAALIEVRYLDPILLMTPALALGASRRELGRAGRRVQGMVDDVLNVMLEADQEQLDELARRDEEVDALYARVVAYLGRISQQNLTDTASAELTALMSAANNLESIGDVVETDLVSIGRRRLVDGVTVSAQTAGRLRVLHQVVSDALAKAIKAVVEDDRRAALAVIELKGDIHRLVEEVERQQALRLVADEPGRVEAYSLEIDMIDKLRHIYYHSKRIAKAVAGAS